MSENARQRPTVTRWLMPITLIVSLIAIIVSSVALWQVHDSRNLAQGELEEIVETAMERVNPNPDSTRLHSGIDDVEQAIVSQALREGERAPTVVTMDDATGGSGDGEVEVALSVTGSGDARSCVRLHWTQDDVVTDEVNHGECPDL